MSTRDNSLSERAKPGRRAGNRSLNFATLVYRVARPLRQGRALSNSVERPDDALALGERALALSGDHSDALARWVRDVALERGNQALALRAAEAAVLAGPTLEDIER